MPFDSGDAQKSLCAFERLVAPALKAAFGDTCKIYSTERHESELAKVIDLSAGIDGFIVDAGGWTLAFSSRVQFSQNYETFSIRRSRPSGSKTEFDKLLNPMQMKPSVHVQSFVDSDETSAVVAIAETVDLIKYVLCHSDQWRRTSTNETFYFVPWHRIKSAKVFFVDAAGHVQKK